MARGSVDDYLVISVDGIRYFFIADLETFNHHIPEIYDSCNQSLPRRVERFYVREDDRWLDSFR